MLTLLKFYAEWCKPCAALKPTIEKLDAEDDYLIVSNVDIDDNPQLKVDYSIRSIPTLVLLRDGEEVARKVGSSSLGELKAWVDEHRRV